MSDSLAWLTSSSDRCLVPQPATHDERRMNILEMSLGITAMGTPRCTRGLTSHWHSFPKPCLLQQKRNSGKKGFRSRAGPQGTESEKGHTQLLRPPGATHGLHVSSFKALLLTYLTSTFLLTISLPLWADYPHSKSILPFPPEKPSHSFPGRACATSLRPIPGLPLALRPPRVCTPKAGDDVCEI